MKSYQRSVNICLVAIMGVLMSTASFAAQTSTVGQAPKQENRQATTADFHWHNNGNPTGGTNSSKH